MYSMNAASTNTHWGAFGLGHKDKQITGRLARANQGPSNSPGHLGGIKKDKNYQKEPLARRKGKISFEIRDRGLLGAPCKRTCEVTCERGRSRNISQLYN